MKRVFLIGWFGRKNLGDDLLFLNAVKLLDQDDVTEIVFFVDDKSFVPYIDSKSVRAKLKPINFENKFKGHMLLKIYKQIIHSDIIMFGGGSMFSDNDSTRLNSLRQKLSQLFLSKILSKKIICIASGFGPINHSRKLLSKVVSYFNIIQARDKSSYDLVKSVNSSAKVIKSLDPAILLSRQGALIDFHFKEKSVDSIKIGLSLSNTPGSNKVDYTKLIQQLKSHLKKTKVIKLYLIQMCDKKGHNDLNLMKKYIDDGFDSDQIEIIEYNTNTALFISELTQLDMVIGERLHSAIISYALNIPCLILPYHSKCLDFAQETSNNYIYPSVSVTDFIDLHKNYKTPSMEVSRTEQLNGDVELIINSNKLVEKYINE